MAGVGDPTRIDIVTHDPDTDAVVLIMTEMREWGSGGRLLPDLQAKFNTYLSFVESGQLAEKYPSWREKPVRIRVDCARPPGPMEREFFRRVEREWLAPASIGLEVAVLPIVRGG